MLSATDLSARERSGFSARVRHSVSETPMILYVPRDVFYGWLMLALLVIPFLPWPQSLLWRLVLVALVWAAGQGFMMWKTGRDPQWHEILLQTAWGVLMSWRHRPDLYV